MPLPENFPAILLLGSETNSNDWKEFLAQVEEELGFKLSSRIAFKPLFESYFGSRNPQLKKIKALQISVDPFPLSFSAVFRRVLVNQLSDSCSINNLKNKLKELQAIAQKWDTTQAEMDSRLSEERQKRSIIANQMREAGLFDDSLDMIELSNGLQLFTDNVPKHLGQCSIDAQAISTGCLFTIRGCLPPAKVKLLWDSIQKELEADQDNQPI